MLAALIVAGVGVLLVTEAVFTPWARSLTGAPTLTGEWLGEMTTATGRKHWVWIDLEHSIHTGQNGCVSCSRIEGTLRTCDATGTLRDYRLWGDVENWSGTRLLLKTQEEPARAGEPVLGALHGQWAGDTLHLTTQLIVRGQKTTTRWEKNEHGMESYSVTGGHPDARAAITWRMHRGAKETLQRHCDSAAHTR